MQSIFAVHGPFANRQWLQIGHQQINGGLQLLNVQWLHLLEHKFWHQFPVAFHFRDTLHATIQFTANCCCLLVSRVQLIRKIQGKFKFSGGEIFKKKRRFFLTINALNRIWCSNFLTPRICWNMSKSCSLLRIISLFRGCMRVGRLCSSSPVVCQMCVVKVLYCVSQRVTHLPVPFRMQSNFAIQDVSTVSLLSPSISGSERTRFSMLLRNTSRKSCCEQAPDCTIFWTRSDLRKTSW